jgi:hypothetical protein
MSTIRYAAQSNSMSRASSDEQRLHDVQGIPTSAKLDHTALGGSGHRKVPHVLDWRPKFMSYRFRHRIPVTHQIQTPLSSRARYRRRRHDTSRKRDAQSAREAIDEATCIRRKSPSVQCTRRCQRLPGRLTSELCNQMFKFPQAHRARIACMHGRCRQVQVTQHSCRILSKRAIM